MTGHWCPTCSSGISERICRALLERTTGVPFPKTRPSWLKNNRGRQMELDGYAQSLELAFEYQGYQHYKPIPFLESNLERLKQRQQDDKRKHQLCLQHGVTLFEIPYYGFPFMAFSTTPTKFGFMVNVTLRQANTTMNQCQLLHFFQAAQPIFSCIDFRSFLPAHLISFYQSAVQTILFGVNHAEDNQTLRCPNRPSQNEYRKRARCQCGIRNAVVASSLPPSRRSGVAAFGRKPPSEFPSRFPAICRDAATPARFPCTFGLRILFHKAQALSSAALTFFKSASGTMPSRFSNRTDGSEPMACTLATDSGSRNGRWPSGTSSSLPRFCRVMGMWMMSERGASR